MKVYFYRHEEEIMGGVVSGYEGSYQNVLEELKEEVEEDGDTFLGFFNFQGDGYPHPQELAPALHALELLAGVNSTETGSICEALDYLMVSVFKAGYAQGYKDAC